MAEDDYCVVCAEPLEWVAYGNCGHRDACSKCVSRLRFVMNDTRCLICQQQDSPVVVTRSLGAYTPVIPPQDFDKLQASSRTLPRPASLSAPSMLPLLCSAARLPCAGITQHLDLTLDAKWRVGESQGGRAAPLGVHKCVL